MTEFNHLLATRNNFIRLIDSLTTEQLNIIPARYSNNIIWNFAHNIVTQQLLCYKLASNEMYIDDEIVDNYRKGSKPTGVVTEKEISDLKKLSLELVSKMEIDLKSKDFNYNSYTTSYNVTLNSIDDAIKFNNVHEGLHLGYAMAMKKLVL
ncbi:DinB family protein [Flavobacteriales bacterium]|nr:DinB family protein [Flavobacteriales bacterium]